MLSVTLEEVTMLQFPHLPIEGEVTQPACFTVLCKGPMNYRLKSVKHSTHVSSGWSSETDVEKGRNQ